MRSSSCCRTKTARAHNGRCSRSRSAPACAPACFAPCAGMTSIPIAAFCTFGDRAKVRERTAARARTRSSLAPSQRTRRGTPITSAAIASVPRTSSGPRATAACTRSLRHPPRSRLQAHRHQAPHPLPRSSPHLRIAPAAGNVGTRAHPRPAPPRGGESLARPLGHRGDPALRAPRRRRHPRQGCGDRRLA
jgi:hypothetical protein